MDVGVGDLFGVAFFTLVQDPMYQDYHECLRYLAPVLRGDGWQGSVNGFYVSGIDRLVRLSYFTTDVELSESAIASLYELSGLMQPRPLKAPSVARVSQNYGGDELPFRRYLCTYACIGLDVIDEPCLQHVQRLCATYRWQIFPLGGSARQHYEKSLEQMSTSYHLMRPEDRDVFWDGFQNKPAWDHMFINMILAADRPLPPDERGSVLSTEELNAVLVGSGLDFDVPGDWTPEASV